MRKWLAALALPAISLAGCAPQQHSAVPKPYGPPLRFAVVSDEPASTAPSKYAPLAGFLAKECGWASGSVEVSARYSKVLSDIAKGDVDVAYVSPLAYVLDSKLVPLGMPFVDNTRLYEGGIFVRADSGVKSIKDLRGRKFAFQRPGSIDGYVYPAGMLKKAGIKVQPVNIGNASAVTTVFKKRADAGCANVESIESTLVAFDKIKQIKVLMRTDPIPNGVIVARGDLPPSTLAQLTKAIADMNVDTDGQLAMKELEFDRMAPATDHDFDSLRKMTRLLRMSTKALDAR